MSCIDGIGQNLVSNCDNQPVPGTEIKAWIGNRLEASFTYDGTNPSKITAIQMASTKQLWTWTGVKKILNPSSSLQVAENRADRFIHGVALEIFEQAAADIENLLAMNDIFIVVEMKNKNLVDGDGDFRAFGIGNGLYKSASDWTANDNEGAIPVEFTNQENEFEKYTWYTVDAGSVAATRTMLEGQETPQA